MDSETGLERGAAPLSTLAIIQARYGSTRLPGKILRTINGLPMLYHVIQRVRQVFPRVVVATPMDPGPEADVLTRFVRVAEQHPEADTFVRVTADCPLWEPAVGRMVWSCWHPNGPYVGTQPEWDGMDTEIFSRDVLMKAMIYAEQREHVTEYMRWQHMAIALGAPTTFRWSVDDAEGLEFVRAVYAACAHCADGVERHTNATGSIGGSEGRMPVFELHVGEGGGLVECTAWDILKTRTGGQAYVSR